MRSVFFDFDSTVVTKESLDEVIALALREHPERERLMGEIAAITDRGMAGGMAFTESVKMRLAVAPLHKRHFEEVGAMLTDHLTPGMPGVFRSLQERGITAHIVSGGFWECILPVAHMLDVPETRCLTNRALFNEDGDLMGVDESSPLWTDDGKAPAIRAVRERDAIPSAILVGDGANDLAAYTQGAVDSFVGFGANVIRESIRARAPYFVTSAHELQTWLDAHLA